MLYVAYGSNINKDQMNFRVPKAKPYGKGVVYNWQLAFHGNDGNAYATIIQSPGKSVPVVIWEMSDKDEAAMDRYEGYPKSYYKKKIPVHVDGKRLEGTVYIMDELRRIGRPSRRYVNTIRFGYETFGLDVNYLTSVLEQNSRDFYLDDIIEVREFKKFGTGLKKKKILKKSKATKSKTPEFKWKINTSNVDVDAEIPDDLSKYMKKCFPEDPYWGSTYGYDDDFVEGFSSNKKYPSLDDYDWGSNGSIIASDGTVLRR